MTDWIDDEARKLDDATRAELESQRSGEQRAAVIAAKGRSYVDDLRREIGLLIDELNAKVLGGAVRNEDVQSGFQFEQSQQYPRFSARSDFEEGRDSFTVVLTRTEGVSEPSRATSLILIFNVDNREHLATKNYRTGRVFQDARELAGAIVKHAYKGGEF